MELRVQVAEEEALEPLINSFTRDKFKFLINMRLMVPD